MRKSSHFFAELCNGWARLDGPAGTLALRDAADAVGEHLHGPDARGLTWPRYAVELFARLRVGGALRAGLLRYNEFDNAERLLAGLRAP
jgi:hypothetical protein